MSLPDLNPLFDVAARLLNAELVEINGDTVHIALHDRQIFLGLHTTATMTYVSGRMTLHQLNPEVEQDAMQVLLSMYLNFSMPGKIPHPIWFGINPLDGNLYAMFSLHASKLTGEFIAQSILTVDAFITELRIDGN